VTNKKSYSRYFIIFQEDDKGFAIESDKPPTGYAKIENKNGRSKVTFYVQNLLVEKGPYTACLIDATKNPPVVAKLGNININENGMGETWWEFREDDIANTGHHIDRFNVACVLTQENLFPLSGQVGRENTNWKEKLLNLEREESEQKEEEKEEKEDTQEAKKFEEYEKAIKEAIKNIEKEHKEDIKNEDEDIKPSRQIKEGDFAKVFHNILKDLEEVKIETEFENTRWWKIPLERPYFEPKYMPYYCIIYHLLLAYPYINYLTWTRKSGYYYFGIKYDDDGEIDYVIYGIEGENNPKDQPFFGATGFRRWVGFQDKGMWVMVYNPWTGMII